MRYILDTNIARDLIRNPGGHAAQRAKQAGDTVCISAIAAAELRYGCAKKASPPCMEALGCKPLALDNAA